MHAIASLGRWLKLRRVALEMTQAELARRVGCAAVTIRLRNIRGTAQSLFSRASAELQRNGDVVRAMALAEESMRLFRQTGDLRGYRDTLSLLGWALHGRGELERGTSLPEEALETARTLGDQQASAGAMA